MNGFAYARNAMGMSAISIAKKLGVTRSAVSLWEHGKSKISSENLAQLSKMLSIPQEYFGEITEEQAQEIDLIIQCNLQEAQQDFELAEIERTNKVFKDSLLRISETAKLSTNQYNSFSDFISGTLNCSKTCNLFADVLKLYGTDSIVQDCLTALIQAKESESNSDNELTQIIRQEILKRETIRDEMKKLSEGFDELF